MKKPLPRVSRADAPAVFLELFFPIHYTAGMLVEDALRNQVLTRQQTVILWMIRVKGEGGKTMRRKDIERALTAWYEVTSSAVSKALRALSQPPLNLVTVTEDPASAREKRVTLTPKGERFIAEMVENGRDLIKQATDQLTQEEIDMGTHFFTRVGEIFESSLVARPQRSGMVNKRRKLR